MPLPGIADVKIGNYDADGQVSDYTREEGRLVCPVMGPVGTPPKVIQVFSPYGFRTVQFASKKRGSPPVFPAIGRDTPSGDVFLFGNLAFAVPSVGGAGGQYDYTCGGEYTYVQAAVRGSGDNFPTGQHPYPPQSASIAALIAGGAGSPWSNNTVRFGWLSTAQLPVGMRGDAQPGDINFKDPDYKYFDTTIAAAFASVDLIV